MNKKKYLCGILASTVLLMSCPIGAMAAEPEETDIIKAQESGSIWFTKDKFNPDPYFSSLSEAWKALNEGYQIVVNDNEGTTYLPEDQLEGKEDTDEMWYVSLEDTFPKNELITIHAVADPNDNDACEMSDSMDIDRLLAIEFGKTDRTSVTDTSITFNGAITIKNGGTLTIQNARRNVYDVSMGTLTFAQPITVEDGGELNVDFVCSSGDEQEGPKVVYSGAESPLITIADGGSASLKNMDITANNSNEPLIEVNGELEVNITPYMSIEPTISTNGTAISVSENATLTLSGGKIENTDGKPAISVGSGATVVIPEDSKAEIKSEGGNAAIDLAPGASVQQGGNTITVAPVEDESASNYVDNHGNIVLESGSEDGKVAPNTVIQPDGTAISGKTELPSVGKDGSVTIPEGGATVTNPEGDKVEVDGNTEIPSIVIGVKDGTTEKVETSKTIELSSGAFTLETAVFDGAINLEDYTCTVISSDTNVATVSTVPDEDGKIVVTPVGAGTADITATYTKKGAAEGVALLGDGDAAGNGTLTATFTVYVYKESSGGDSSSDDSDPTYNVALPGKVTGGSVKVSPRNAEKGETVTITVTPDDGYELDQLTVTDRKGNELDLTEKAGGKFTFKMPASRVEIEVSFKLVETEPEAPVFADVPADAYYADAVAWAVEQGVTTGTGANTFSPDLSCTRAQMVTFLWRANGSPVVDYAMDFTDVPADAYYADAVRWAVSKGITSGTSATTFAPDMTVTRSQTVTFLYRAAGTPAVSGGSFADVAADAYYADAVAWAVKEGVTSGTGGNSFSPDAPCTRAQIVTFLYRDAQ